MSILVRFTGAPGLSAQQYDEVLPRIEAAGEFPPDGLDYHVAFSAGGSFRVSEIWDSMEQFEAFGQRLMPILAAERHRARGPARGHRDPQHHQALGRPVDERSGHHPGPGDAPSTANADDGRRRPRCPPSSATSAAHRRTCRGWSPRTCSRRPSRRRCAGKLGDLYGRKIVFQTAIVIFLIGSALCGDRAEHDGADRLPRRSRASAAAG